MKSSHYLLAITLFAGLLLPGCSTLREAVMGREHALTPLDFASLGHTPQNEILQKYGTPDEIDERRADTHTAEVFYYFEQAESEDNRYGYPELKILACEFEQGVLNGYLYQKLGRSGAGDFAESSRAKLLKGRTTRREAQAILGPPNGKSLLPTTLNVPALAGQVGGVPAALDKLPANAREAWFYSTQTFDEGQRRVSEQSLILYFDEQGIYLGSTGLRQLVTRLP